MAVAVAHEQAGRYADAEREYRRILLDQPTNVAALNNLAVVLQATGRSQDAIANLQRAIILAPKDARLHANLGNALLDGQMDAEAIIAYRHALALDPGMAEVHNDLGGLLHRSGDLRGSAECYQRVLARHHQLQRTEIHGTMTDLVPSIGSCSTHSKVERIGMFVVVNDGGRL